MILNLENNLTMNEKFNFDHIFFVIRVFKEIKLIVDGPGKAPTPTPNTA